MTWNRLAAWNLCNPAWAPLLECDSQIHARLQYSTNHRNVSENEPQKLPCSWGWWWWFSFQWWFFHVFPHQLENHHHLKTTIHNKPMDGAFPVSNTAVPVCRATRLGRRVVWQVDSRQWPRWLRSIPRDGMIGIGVDSCLIAWKQHSCINEFETQEKRPSC